MDNNFTKKLGEWLNSDPNSRDYHEGAMMLLKLSGNKIMYANIMRAPDARRDFIEYQLQKYYNFRVRALTHDQVEEMAARVEVIVKERALDKPEPKEEGKRAGRRPDHDQLPDEIKAMFVENLTLLHKMREVHLQLRKLSLDDATCPDSERFPFVQEIIELDKKMHTNYQIYDTYNVETGKAAVPVKKAKREPKATTKTTKNTQKTNKKEPKTRKSAK